MSQSIQLINHIWPGRLNDVNRAIQLVIADPPYNYGIEYADDLTADQLNDHDYMTWCFHTLAELTRLLDWEKGVLVWICPASHGSFIWQILKNLNLKLMNDCPVIWYESFSQYQQTQLTVDYRLIFIAGFNGVATIGLNNIREKSKRQQLGDKRADPRGRVPGMVWDIRRLQGTSIDRVLWHKAQLPPELYSRLIHGWSEPNSLVMDAFAGSGTCGLVCQRLKRSCVLVDQSPTYLAKIKERLNG